MACQDLLSLYPHSATLEPKSDHSIRGEWLLSAGIDKQYRHSENGFMDFAHQLSSRVINGIAVDTPWTYDNEAGERIGCHMECALISSGMSPEDLDKCFTCVVNVLQNPSKIENKNDTDPKTLPDDVKELIDKYKSAYASISEEIRPDKKVLMSTAFNCLGCISDGYHNAPAQDSSDFDHQTTEAYKFIVDHACNCLTHNNGASDTGRGPQHPALPFAIVISVLLVLCIAWAVYIFRSGHTAKN
jgi:hypothetical protein